MFKKSIVLGSLVLTGCGVKFFGNGVQFSSEKKFATYDYELNVGQMKSQTDILFVDDNSPSMNREQEKIGEKFSSFIGSLGSLDWRIAITTTDVRRSDVRPGSGSPDEGEDGKLVAFQGGAPAGTYFITPATADKEKYFKETIHMGKGEGGSGDERGIYAAYRAIERNEKSFIRGTDAHLAVVIVSDEDERSNGGTFFNKSGKPFELRDYPANLIALVDQMYGGQKPLTVHALSIHPSNEACLKYSPGKHGSRTYALLVSLTRGIFGDLCAADYATELQSIGSSIQGTADSFQLACDPYEGKIEVALNPEPSPEIKYEIKGSRIYFDPVVPPGTKVRLKYTCLITD